MSALGGLTTQDLGVLRGGSSKCESVQTIINIASTAEALAISALGAAIGQAEAGNLSLNDEQLQFVEAAQCEEKAHYDYLMSAGAKPLTTSFTLPSSDIGTDAGVFLKTVIGLEEAFIAAYMAAAQEFAILGQDGLVRNALQIGGVEAEHRAHARFYALTAGVSGVPGKVPNNLAFEKAMFTSVGAAAAALKHQGWLGSGSGGAIKLSDFIDSVDCTGVMNEQP